VLDALFPNWSSPAAVAAVVGLVAASNATLVALIAARTSRPFAAVAAAAGVGSVVTATLVVRADGLGTAAGNAELLARAALILAAVGATLRDRTPLRVAAGAVAVAVAFGLLAVTIPLYGEATVAP